MQFLKNIISVFSTIMDFRRSCAELELRALADEAEYRARVCAVMHRLRQQGVPEHVVKDLERKAFSASHDLSETQPISLPHNHQPQPARLPPAQPSQPQPTQPQQPQPSNGQPHEGKKKRGRPPRNNQQDPPQKLWS